MLTSETWWSSRSLWFDVVLSLLSFSAFATVIAFQFFSSKHYLQISGLRMPSVTCNRLSIKKIWLLIRLDRFCEDYLLKNKYVQL